ncbi:MAG TPA: SDR family oxidoreductase [Pseudonocardia sp.]|jgi:NAD(P)-dependent dehydrogenase (short-subunit alcohol dehydrogenase family)|nr:SDR family oxidoreductase [Pseudonocardia sp.]
MEARLDGRVALVTGAGSGIGAASAAALAGAGAAVAVTDIDLAAAEKVATGITERGGRAVTLRLDVASEPDWRAAVATATGQLGPVTVLHSNAALTSRADYAADLGVIDLEVEVFDRVIAVNLRGGVLGCKHVLPGMLAAGGGSIVLTSSVKGSTGSAHRTAYSVSKGGLDALVRTVATAYGKAGVRCNAVAPGIVATEAVAAIPAAQRAELADAHLTPELGTPADIANAVVFLASDLAAFITGQVLRVDGGLAAHTAALSPPGTRVAPTRRDQA